jgi:dTDP-4-dehydrorhamnose reductase
MNQILLLGGTGILGSEVRTQLAAKNIKFESPSSTNLDIRDFGQLSEYVQRYKPQWMINCAAWTNVDGAEESYDHAKELNEVAVRNIAEIALVNSCSVIHISTDYVFDGLSSAAYDENSPVKPVNKYGESKLLGENVLVSTLPNNSYVIRTSWLYGISGRNFVKTMAAKALKSEAANVVDDQVGSPTSARDLARAILAIIEKAPAPGLYHYSNSGSCSWFELARAIFSKVGVDPALVLPIKTASLNVKATRPHYSLLSKEKWRSANLSVIPEWEEALEELLPEILDELRYSEAL